MPKLSTNRRSTRTRTPEGRGDNGSLTAEATAHQLLVSQLEKEGWRELRNRKTGVIALFKRGFTIENAVDKESMVQAEGFTLKKYEKLFFDTMDEEDLEEWTDRLPDHPKLPAKTKKRALTIVDEEESEEEYELVGGAASSKAKATKAKKPSKKQATKKLKKQSKKTKGGKQDDDLDSDGEDGMPSELRKVQKENFDTWLEAKAEFDSFSPTKSAPKSLKQTKAIVKTTMKVIVANVRKNDEMTKFKRERGDVIARKVKAAVGEYVKEQAAILEKELLEDMLLDKYEFDNEEEEVVDDEEEVGAATAMTDESGGEEVECGDASPDVTLSDGEEVR